jgi:hypothetical protein
LKTTGLATVPDPIRNSLHALLEFTRRVSGADGYAIYELHNGALILRDSNGVVTPESDNLTIKRAHLHPDGRAVIAYPLNGGHGQCGLVSFTFYKAAVNQQSMTTLDRLAQTIESVFILPHVSARLASEISNLEVELTAIKINDRTLGLLENGEATDESVATVIKHVDSVLRRRPALAVLEQLLEELDDRVAERKLFGKAKLLLQTKQNISEEEAYLVLRRRSRESRRRLRDVATELISELPQAR